MPIVNLKQQYPHLYEETMLEISDPIFEVYKLSRKKKMLTPAAKTAIGRIIRWMLETLSNSMLFSV